ncbi:hypothetical protein [Variovorax rhizosphaerae]|uniref:Uncharacterized protein n=1 Tax=Variovorax rhizosphaerae TaxID=1836200 RepID=A0ABU8WVN8_9BURK
MSSAANSLFFDQVHWRVIASGFDTERWFNDGQAVGTGGIANPQPTRVPAGHYYYRFASSSASRASRFGGGWWVDFENFNLVRRFAAANGYSLRDAARLMLALPYAWTRVDQLVRALLCEPLRAYTGPGKAAQGSSAGGDRGTRWIPTQHVRVRQLYIPGLFVDDGRDPLFERVFVQPMEVTPLG